MNCQENIDAIFQPVGVYSQVSNRVNYYSCWVKKNPATKSANIPPASCRIGDDFSFLTAFVVGWSPCQPTMRIGDNSRETCGRFWWSGLFAFCRIWQRLLLFKDWILLQLPGTFKHRAS
jgi:hypothetical protein